MVGCQWCTYPSIHLSFHCADALKIMVGCLSCTYPSIHTKTCADSEDHGRLTTEHISRHSPFCWRRHSQDHVRLPDKCISKHSYRNLQTCWTPWSTRETRGLWARPPVLTPVPVQAFHSRACLNLHHSDIQGTAQKSPCVNTFFEAIAKKKKKGDLLVTVWELGQDTQNKDTRDNGHV